MLSYSAHIWKIGVQTQIWLLTLTDFLVCSNVFSIEGGAVIVPCSMGLGSLCLAWLLCMVPCHVNYLIIPDVCPSSGPALYPALSCALPTPHPCHTISCSSLIISFTFLGVSCRQLPSPSPQPPVSALMTHLPPFKLWLKAF